MHHDLTLKWLRRYEVQGEYVLPSSTTLPRSVKPVPRAAGKEASKASNPFEEGAGRWRLQVILTHKSNSAVM